MTHDTPPKLIWTRDLDGTGSQHPCWPDDEGAIAYILASEAVAAATPTMQRAARVLHDEAMAAAYLGENVTDDEAAMLQFIDALGGKTKVINALHALATATKGATP